MERCGCGALVEYRANTTPVSEGVCKDADGADIAVLLHMGKDGFLSMLEIIKYDGSQIIKPPSAENLAITFVPKYQVLGPGNYRPGE